MRLANLSPLSLIEVELYQYAAATLRWGEIYNASSEAVWCLPIDGDLTNRLGTKNGYLEMYGGAGLGANAGGVRCANVGDVQIKGIGLSCLAGNGTDKWHRHGAMSLQDAVKEAIFSELFHVAAPLGAVRAVGVHDLGVRFATEIGREKLPGSAPRALFVREQSVRVGHFMRASFMGVGPDLAVREVARMRNGIPSLVNHLVAVNELVNFGSAAQALLRMFDRLMHQIAVLRTKRLIHGSLIPSNFCIDGRLLDFTTSTAVSTLQPVMVSLGGLSSQRQHHQILECLPDLLFYVSKFDVRCKVERQVWAREGDEMTAQLHAAHHEYLMHEHLHLFGFSSAEARHLRTETRNAVLESLLRVIGRGHVGGHMYFGGDEHPMPPQAGTDDLFAAVAFALTQVHGLVLPDSGNYSPEPYVFGESVLAQMVNAYAAAAQELDGPAAGAAAPGLSRLIRAMQRNADLSGLYRRRLDGEINEVCESGGSFGRYIDDMIGRWRNVFCAPPDGVIELGGWLTQQEVRLLANGDIEVNGRPMQVIEFCRFEPAAGIASRHAWLFEAVYTNSDDAFVATH